MRIDKGAWVNWIADGWPIEEVKISEHDKAILRDLAKQFCELCEHPIEQEKIALWIAHNDLQETRPVILVDMENGWNEAIRFDRDIQCEVTIAFWKDFIAHCKTCGVEQIAIEEFPGTMVWSASTLLKLREATDPMLGINLDPSHMMALGADPIAAARALKGCIYHVHGKDARIERGLADRDGILEPRPVTESADRVWNYVAVGCGKDLQWWKEFFSVCRMMGYNGDVSLEMEDLTMSAEAGLQTSIDALNQTISK